MEFISVAVIDNPQFTIDINMWFLTILISYCKPTKIKITINKKNYISLRERYTQNNIKKNPRCGWLRGIMQTKIDMLTFSALRAEIKFCLHCKTNYFRPK